MDIETHPFEPFLPKNAKLILLGTFPPAPKRWCMEWYYPNFMNDMWRIIGLCFFGDKEHFVKPGEKTWRLDELKDFLAEKEAVDDGHSAERIAKWMRETLFQAE